VAKEDGDKGKGSDDTHLEKEAGGKGRGANALKEALVEFEKVVDFE